MTTSTLAAASVLTQANVYFEGKCISHSLVLADGSKKSVGVILPSTLRFSTNTPEVMECVAGACEWRMEGSDEWQPSRAGEQFTVPANAVFHIRATEPYHYICHFG